MSISTPVSLTGRVSPFPRRLATAAALATVAVVFFLFFIDEGYYDLRWMGDAGNWFMFLVYLAFVFPVQWLLAGMVTRLARRPVSLAIVVSWLLVADFLVFSLILWLL